MRRVCYAAYLLADPGIQEPVYLGALSVLLSALALMSLFQSRSVVLAKLWNACMHVYAVGMV
jgi:hypothetical protein